MRLNKLIMTIVLLVFAGSTFADNLSVADVTLAAGESKKIAIELNNPNADYSAFQFDLVLPEGISIDKNKKDKLIVSLNADRIDDHTLNSSVVGSNTYRFICFSMSNSEFEDSEGDLLYITLKADDGVSNGALTATIKSQVFTQGDCTQVKWSDMSFTITTSGAEVAVPVITADNKTRVYGDENPELTYSADMELTGKPELSTTATKSSAVGEYDITVGKGTSTGDFTAKNGKLTITKAPLTITASNFTITQGEKLPTFTVSSYTGFKNGETEKALAKQPTFTCSATSASAPGTYDITMSGAEAQNYDVKYIKGTLTIIGNAGVDHLNVDDVEIKAGESKRVAIELVNPNGDYAAFQFDLVLPEGVKVDENNKGKLLVSLNADRIDDHTLNSSDVGSNTYRFICFSMSNSEFEDSEGDLLYVTLRAAETVGSGTKTATIKSQVFTQGDGTQVKWSDLSFTIKTDVAEVAVPVITADNKTRVYGDENPELTYSADMELNGKPELSTTATKSSAVGEYDITVGKGTLTGDFTAKNGKLTITKAPLTVGVQDVTITEGDAIPTFTLTYSGWKNGDTEADAFTANPAAKTTATTSSKAGTYDITVSGGTAKNYELAYTKGTLTILKKEEPVTVTANNLTMVYGDDIPALTYKSEGAELNGTPQLSTTATKASAVGTYPIEVEAGTVTNTKATYVNGTLTITKAPLTITAKSYTIKQGEALPIFATTYSGFKNNETESVLTKKSTFACAVPLDMTPGTYDITASGAEAQNYEISYVKGTLTIEKKDEPEPITRTPFKGKISIPGILEAENFDKGGEGVTYHDNDAEDHGGTNYRSGADMGVDIVTGNGGYALGWTNGGEWAEYTVNVIEAGKYTLEAIVSNGTGDTGGFSISLVGDGGSLTKLADVNVPSTAGNWDNYQPVKGELLQNLEVGSQIFRITITAGNCNIDKIKFELKKDEPEPEPEPAYKVGDDITSLATTEWEGKTGDYGGLANASVERYTHGAPADMDDILTQTVSGLENGTYRVQLEAAASFTPERGFDCPTGDGLSVVFANGTQRNLAVVERDWVDEGAQKIVTLTATVTDGTLKYGIKNLKLSGNWFVARLKSIVYISTEAQSPKTYAISIAAEQNGKTTTDVTADEEGSRVFITATPNEDCTLESLKVTTTGGKELEVTGNSFIMPASAVTVTATYKAPEPDAIEDVIAEDGVYQIFTLDGKPVETLQKGVNIIRYSDGTTKSVYVK